MKLSTTSERLKKIMKENNFRQIDILNKCSPYCQKYGIKIGRNDLSQYVNGKVEPGQDKLSILSMALGINEAWLMGYDVPRNRNAIIIKDHKGINEEVLYAIQILASKSGYHLSIFANQYQIELKDCIVKLSPKEIEDYVISSIDKIAFVTENIIQNKLHDNISSIREDIPLLNAAHAIEDATEEDKIHDENIMDDDDF